ncbi:hypothetical protein TWF696_004867 [Orbilia brochopaga]|uniref:J domain-containing protein n=1 Tax=Orbilia brochopaga TaxID=3140254 RepID=A0AAV9UZ04_9PEZI
MPSQSGTPEPVVSHYYILEVEHDATTDQIKRAFRCLSRRYHTDKNPGVDATQRAELNAKFTKLYESYKCLVDKHARQTYDTRCASIVFSHDEDPGNWFRQQYEREKQARKEEDERRRREERERNAARARDKEFERAEREKFERTERERKEEEARAAEEQLKEFLAALFGLHGVRKSAQKPTSDTTSSRTAKSESPDASTSGTPPSSTSPQESDEVPKCSHPDEPEYCANCYARNFSPAPTWSSGARWSAGEYDALKELRKQYPCGPYAWDVIASTLNDQYGRGRSVSAVKSKYYK